MSIIDRALAKRGAAADPEHLLIGEHSDANPPGPSRDVLPEPAPAQEAPPAIPAAMPADPAPPEVEPVDAATNRDSSAESQAAPTPAATPASSARGKASTTDPVLAWSRWSVCWP